MWRYIRRRLLTGLATLFGVSAVVFAMMKLIPGDPVKFLVQFQQGASRDLVAELQRRYNLDRPVPVQYVLWLTSVVRGDLGRSIVSGIPVKDELFPAVGRTAVLGLAAMLLAWAVAFPVGLVSAAYRGRGADAISRVASVIGLSMPSFWVGLLLLSYFAVRLNWVSPLPPARISFTSAETWRYLILPAATLGVPNAALVSRLLRGGLVDVLDQPFITAASAKGLGRSRLLLHHALRIAMTPVLTVMGLQLALVLGGAVVVEEVFSWPGLGRLLVQAVNARDLPVVQSV